MKLTVIGGGGVRSMFLAKSIAQRAHDLHITELVFMDCDADKLRIYGGLARHVARLLDPALKFTLFERFSPEALEVSEQMEMNGRRTFGYDEPILYKRV